MVLHITLSKDTSANDKSHVMFVPVTFTGHQGTIQTLFKKLLIFYLTRPEIVTLLVTYAPIIVSV